MLLACCAEHLAVHLHGTVLCIPDAISTHCYYAWRPEPPNMVRSMSFLPL